MDQGVFFAEVPAEPTLMSQATDPKDARVNRAVRNQVEMVMRDLDSLVADDHPVRMIWHFLERLDLVAFYSSIEAVISSPGRPATDPKVLLGIWLYATIEGVGSARKLDRLCQEHDAYRWLAGLTPINYHVLSDFRVGHRQALDNLLTEIIAAMMAADIAKLNGAAQDGLRVRASAGSGSFRRKAKLEDYLQQAREQVEMLADEVEHPDGQWDRREQAARQRAALERERRVEEAPKNLEQVQAAKERQVKTPRREKVREARASTTDPEARIMKMPNGGFRPAYNVQLVTDAEKGVVVGVGVSNMPSAYSP